jgi:dTDP-4-dehydrorhamnose reductase
VEYHAAPDFSEGAAAITPLIEQTAPDVIINAAGAIKQHDLYSAIDQTFFINGVLPHLLAQLAGPRGARVVHFSTDCVFKGDRGNYSEADKPDVEDLYGRSKAMGEIDYGSHLTIRTSIIGFELTGHFGLLGWFLKQPPGSNLKGFNKAIYSGLPTVTLARLVRDLIVSPLPLTGLYHVASEPIDKFTLLSMVNDALGLGHKLRPNEDLQIDRSLDDTRFRTTTNTKRPGWAELVRDLAEDFNNGSYPQIYRLLYA